MLLATIPTNMSRSLQDRLTRCASKQVPARILLGCVVMATIGPLVCSPTSCIAPAERPASEGKKYRQIQVSTVDGITVVTFVQARILSEKDVQVLGDELWALVDRDGCRLLVLDWKKIEFCSSAVIGKIVRLDKKVKDKNGKLRLCCMKPEIREVFQITRLDQVFEIKDTREEALASLRKE